jgi:hypothetical protein
VLDISLVVSNELRESWQYVLAFLSRLDNLHNVYSTRSDITFQQLKNIE